MVAHSLASISPLLMTLMLGGVTARPPAGADDCVVLSGARLYASEYGGLGFKVTYGNRPGQRVRGRLFDFHPDGRDRTIWEAELATWPSDVHVVQQSRTVVSISGRACSFDPARVLVIYSSTGATLATYRLRDLFSPDEIESRLRRTTTAVTWADQTSVAFDPYGRSMTLTFEWGRSLVIDLTTGKVLGADAPSR